MSVDRAKALGEELLRIWEDQFAFNMLFRDPPTSPGEMAKQAQDFVTYTESEMHELLRTLPWKKHRNMPFRGNPAHMFEEGADIFKCVLSLFQIIGVKDPEHLFDLYWHKTAVVRQRYREEWVEKLDRDCVIVDIDNVLCDYITGMATWIRANYSGTEPLASNLMACERNGLYMNAKSLGISDETWQSMKHKFRTSGAKRRLPVFDDAKEFLERCRASSVRIVLLTSRPIDQYPNLFTDTILWLNDNGLPFDFVWWSAEKAERVLMEDGLRDKVIFAVDDDEKFVRQFMKAGIPTYWLRRQGDFVDLGADWKMVVQIRSLKEATVLAAMNRRQEHGV